MNKAPWINYINGSDDVNTHCHYRSLIEKVKARASEIMDTMDVEFTPNDPYKNSKEMRTDIVKNKIKVYTWESSHPVFSNKENNLFRLVHDIDWHWLELTFSLEDEIKTHFKMVEKLNLNVNEARALYTEIVWQVTAYYITWEFQKQKALFIN